MLIGAVDLSSALALDPELDDPAARAEIVAVRHGREGGRLVHGSGPIRAAPA